jgi:hypothetical protein
MNGNNTKITCIHCGVVLAGNHSGPCPSCGKLGKQCTVTSSGGFVVGGAAPISTMRIIYEKNKIAWILLIVITFGAPFLGLFVIENPRTINWLSIKCYKLDYWTKSNY